ncbi:MAG: type I methionyl aminopeptidase [Nitrospirae bacterium]|nr:type I methionyl aminopeptidase [Nitrospirota bacterium]
MIILKSPEEIEKIRAAGKMVAEVFEEVKTWIRPGITTLELDRMAETAIRKRGGTPAFKGYRGFPCTLCTSLNEEIVHGIPSIRKVLEGDILGVDMGVWLDGYYGDSAISFPIGKVSDEAKRLLQVAEESLYRGIEKSRVGNRLSDISYAIQSYVEDAGYSVVREFVGHGIGRDLHEEPQVPNYGTPGKGPRLKTGMVLAIEPMVNIGGPHTRVLADQWTAVTRDGSLSAHFEHTVAILEDGPRILTVL